MVLGAASQPLCAVSTILCFARAVPLWTIALIGLALVPVRAFVARQLRQRKSHAC